MTDPKPCLGGTMTSWKRFRVWWAKPVPLGVAAQVWAWGFAAVCVGFWFLVMLNA
jgi:hypothetical protein